MFSARINNSPQTGAGKKKLAAGLGARGYIDASHSDPGGELRKLGGASVILATAPDARTIGLLLDGLAKGGKLVLVAGILDSIGVPAIELIQKRLSIVGRPSGTSKDSEDALRFSALKGVRPIGRELSARSRIRSILAHDLWQSPFPERHRDGQLRVGHSQCSPCREAVSCPAIPNPV